MVLFPKSGFGRFLLGLIVLSTISYLVLNLVSFGGTPWIVYNDVPIRFGLWRICNTSATGLCAQWVDSDRVSNVTMLLFTSKPDFIRTSQALEIISLIFYVIAAILIILGILNLDGLPYQTMFMAAAALLFICIIFLSATLGVMSVQGRRFSTYASLDWAWWNGLVGLIMTIVTFFALIILLLDMNYSSTNKASGTKNRALNQINTRGGPPQGGYGMGGNAVPALVMSNWGGQPYNYPNYNQPSHQQYSNYNQYPQENYHQQHQYSQQNYPNYHQQPQQNFSDNYPNAMMAYGGQSPAEQYFNNQNSSPIISQLARQYVFDIADNQYRNQLLEPYRQYVQDPYIINNYL